MSKSKNGNSGATLYNTSNNILTISLKDDAVEQLDSLKTKLKLSGRSETMRAGLRLLSQEQSSQEKLHGTLTALLLLTHPEQNDEELGKIRHQYQKLIKTQLHDHLDNHRCMELLILRGEAKELVKMARACGSCKSVEAKLLPV